MWCRGVSKRIGDGDLDSRSESGFTLIELLLVTVLIPIIVGALAAGLLSVFFLQQNTKNRLADTSDAQITLEYFQNDIQSASQVTTDAQQNPQCGSGTELLGLESNPTSSGGFNTVISYDLASNGTSQNLVRKYCASGSPEVDTIVSYDVPNSETAPQLACLSTAPAGTCSALIAASGWVNTQYVANVTFPVTEPKSNFSYTLVAAPQAAATTGDAGAPVVVDTSTKCQFANPVSGTYAGTLCFMDFSALDGLTSANYLATLGGSCLEMQLQLSGNNVLYFCLGITGGAIQPNAMPTYTGAFLGKLGYTGVGGEPALYTVQSGENPSVLTFSNINVVNSATGLPDTGWQLVSADAEQTNQNESISWTVSGANNPVLNAIPTYSAVSQEPSPNNATVSPVGDACNDGDPVSSGGNGYLTGLGTQTVTCSGGSNVDVGQLHGTAVLASETPTTLQATMTTGGQEAITFGVLQP